MQQSGKDYEILLVNNLLIRANIDFLTTSQTSEISLIIDINADKLDFVFNPKTICTLINFLVDSDLFCWNRTIFGDVNIMRNQIQCKINTKIRKINVQLISMIMSTEIHLQNISLNICT